MTGAWSWWQGGLALAGVSLLHWLWQGRLLAVSGRITALLRRRRPVTVDDDLAAELARATAEAFPDAPPVAPPRRRWDGAEHLWFLLALVAGGGFAQVLVPAPAEIEPSWAVLLAGGLLVGAGTRMASGCTSGHGLSGVSRFQPGSLAAIAATFAGGIATTWLLGGAVTGHVVLGTLFGYVLARIRFTSWHEVNLMFSLRDPRLVGSFVLAVVLLAGIWRVVARAAPARFTPPRVPFAPRQLLGGLLFGAGWALSGACPSIALAALAQRRASAVIVLVGLVAGNWLWGEVNDRWLHWSQRGCSSDD